MKNRQPRHFRHRAAKGAFSPTAGRQRTRVQVTEPSPFAQFGSFAPTTSAGGGAARPASPIIDPLTRKVIGWLVD